MTSTIPAKEKRPFKIVPATLDDVNAMAKISGDCFKVDTHTLLQDAFEGDSQFEEGARATLPTYFKHPLMQMMVARDGVDGEGEVIGQVFWRRKGFPDASFPLPPAPYGGFDGTNMISTGTSTSVPKPQTIVPQSVSSKSIFPPGPAPVTTPSTPGEPLSLKELRQTNSAAMTHFEALIQPPGAKLHIVQGLAVAPAHQSRGIGSALLKFGTDQADADGVYTYVPSSMMGWPAYSKAGFVEVGKLEVCLDDYAAGHKMVVTDPETGEKKETEFGNYVWRWSVRDPR